MSHCPRDRNSTAIPCSSEAIRIRPSRNNIRDPNIPRDPPKMTRDCRFDACCPCIESSSERIGPRKLRRRTQMDTPESYSRLLPRTPAPSNHCIVFAPARIRPCKPRRPCRFVQYTGRCLRTRRLCTARRCCPCSAFLHPRNSGILPVRSDLCPPSHNRQSMPRRPTIPLRSMSISSNHPFPCLRLS